MKLLLIILYALTSFQVQALDSLSYSGRLVNSDGSPVTGPVDLKFDLRYTNDLANPVPLCTKTFTGGSAVPLSKGIFHVKLDYSSADCGGQSLTTILANVPANESIAVQVTDETHSTPYSHQAIHSIPSSIMANMAKTLLQMGATDGQVLMWNDALSRWEPGTVSAGGGGTVTQVNTGSGLTGGPFTTSGTISIANSGVQTSHLQDSSVTDAKLAGSISRSKISNGSPSQVVVNDGTGVLSSVAQIPLTQGGTGAANASDARSNLGLGNAATANIGFAAGNVMGGDVVPICLPGQVLTFNAGPTYFSCVIDSYSDPTKLPLAGGTMSGVINMGGNPISDIGTPIAVTDAATKGYVDAQITGSTHWTTNGTDVYRTSGNVGIGTSSPSIKLQVETNDDSSQGIFARNSNAGANASSFISVNSDAGQSIFSAFSSTHTVNPSTAMINAGPGLTNGLILNTSSSSPIIFNTNNSEKVRIDSSGNVGIGTITPNDKLHIENGSFRIIRSGTGQVGGGAFYNDDLTSNNGIGILFGSNDLSGERDNGARIQTLFTGRSASGLSASLTFQTNNDSENPVERMRINHLGSVGIGLTSPTAALHLKAGTADANTAPLKLTAGTNLTTPEPGAVEFDGTNLYYTDMTNTRRTIATASGSYNDVSTISGPGAISISAGGTNQNITLTASGTGTVTSASPMVVTSTTTSTSPTTGAMTVSGGLGVQENINAGGTVSASTSMITPLIYGSTAASGSLTLDSTTSATKGNIILAPAGGKVGIGTSSPLSLLHLENSTGSIEQRMNINNTDGAEAFFGVKENGSTALSFGYFRSSANPTGREFRVSSTNTLASNVLFSVEQGGNVGIGTTSPGYKLDIAALSGAVEPTSLKLSGSAPQGLQMRIGDSYSATMGTQYSSGDTFLTSNAYQTTWNTNSWSKNTSTLGSTIAFLGIGAAANAPAFQVMHSPAGTATSGTSTFFPNTLLTVLANSNVGIGTTSPSSNLHVNNSTDGSDTVLKLNSSDGSWLTNQELRVDFLQQALTVGRIAQTYYNSDWGFNFYGYQSGLNTSPIMSMRGTGNIGVGTINPSARFEISSPTNNILRLNNPSAAASGVGASLGFYNTTSDYLGGMDVKFNGGTANANKDLNLYSGGDVVNPKVTLKGTGLLGIGVTSPTSVLHLKAGTAAANTAPLKFSAGTNLTTPEPGAVEFDGTNLYYTDMTNTRRTIATASGSYTDVSSISGPGAISISAGGTNQNITLAASGTGTVTSSSPMVVSSTAASTSPTTGAMTISGGLGVQENIRSGGIVSALNSMVTPLLYGSSAASGDLTLVSTTDSTKGNVLINPTTGFVGIGTYSPSHKLVVSHVTPDGTSSEHGLMIDRKTATTTNVTSNDKAINTRFIVYDIPAGITDSGMKVGLDASVYASNSNFAGTLSKNIGVWARAGIFSAAAGARVNNVYGVQVDHGNNQAGATVDNSYGIYLNAWTGGATTNLYDVYANTATAKNYFAGNVGIGTLSPSAKLEISGDMTLSRGAARTLSVATPTGSVATPGNDLTIKAGSAIGGTGSAQVGGNLNLIAGSVHKSTPAGGWGGHVNVIAGPTLDMGQNWGGDISFMVGRPSATALFISGGGVVGRGNVGIGTSSPSEKLHVIGNILASGTINPSDIRLKKNFSPITNSLEKIQSIQSVTYDWKDEKHGKSRQMGVIAQEVKKVFPEAVTETKDGFLAVSYTSLISPVIGAIKELSQKVLSNEEEVTKLTKKIDNLQRSPASDHVINEELKLIKNENELLKKKNLDLEKRLERLEKSLLKN